jgi:hypothetical protein
MPECATPGTTQCCKWVVVGGDHVGADANNIFLRGIMWQLRTGSALPLGDIIEDTTGGHNGDKGDSSEGLKAATPCGQLRVGRRRGLQLRWPIRKGLSLDVRAQETHWGGGRCGK